MTTTKSLTVPGPKTPLAGPTEVRVIAACREALLAQASYALKAVIAGQLMIEYRAAQFSLFPNKSPRSHSGNVGRFESHGGDAFVSRLEKESGVPKSTAYRWMEAAERVSRSQLRLPQAFPIQNSIEVEGVQIPLSQALTAPEGELPPEAIAFRQGVFGFLEDKTLTEALNAAVDGESPAHRFTRAAAGKLDGGHRGEDRKNFPEFISRNLSDVTTHLKHWKTFTGDQKELTEEHFKRAMEKWPTALLEKLRKQIGEEMKKR